jgi:hypothetical protein
MLMVNRRYRAVERSLHRLHLPEAAYLTLVPSRRQGVPTNVVAPVRRACWRAADFFIRTEAEDGGIRRNTM